MPHDHYRNPIIGGNELARALEPEGLLPPECAHVQILMPIDGPMQIEYRVNVTQDDLPKLLRAIATVWDNPNPFATLVSVGQKLDRILTQEGRILMVNQQTRDAMARLDRATSDLSARITAALAKINTGMSQEDVDSLNQELGQVAANLDGMAKDPENPVADV